jgi:WD40 repeat protein
MTTRYSFILTSILAVAAIIAAAAVVLARDRSTPADESAVASPSNVDQSAPDTSGADGVILVQHDATLQTFAPDGTALGPPQAVNSGRRAGYSADGRWFAGAVWQGQSYGLAVEPADEASLSVKIDALPLDIGANVAAAEWSPGAPVIAITDADSNLYLYHPEGGVLQPVAVGVTAIAWAQDSRLVFATNLKDGPALWSAGIDGNLAPIGHVAAPVTRLFPSQNRDEFAFSQIDGPSWSLRVLRTWNGHIDDLGVLGRMSDSLNSDMPIFAISWSRDGHYLAVGPASRSYALYVFDRRQGGARYFAFHEGYPGELAWSPVSDTLAISTYSPDRTDHQMYVFDAGSTFDPRHVIDGCRIVWSPDGAFVAVKREPHKATGVSVVRLESGEDWPLTTQPGYIPVAWNIDVATAFKDLDSPYRLSAVLGK